MLNPLQASISSDGLLMYEAHTGAVSLIFPKDITNMIWKALHTCGKSTWVILIISDDKTSAQDCMGVYRLRLIDISLNFLLQPFGQNK